MCMRPRPLPEARAAVRKCLTEGDFVESIHFRQRLAALGEEKGVTIQDVIHIGQHGGIYCEAEFDTKYGEWKYRLEGTSADGLLIALIFCLKEDDLALLITIFEQR
jgi:hypothetical protein